jgi:hypothetical protein
MDKEKVSYNLFYCFRKAVRVCKLFILTFLHFHYVHFKLFGTRFFYSQKENTRGKHSIAKGKVKGDKPFDSMNGIAANLLLHLTSSMRFEGSLNGI